MIVVDTKEHRVHAVIVAGGSGRRMGSDIPKQYLALTDKDGHAAPILTWTAYAFCRSELVDEVILVVPESDLGMVAEEVVDEYGLDRVSRVVAGGATRQESTAAGVAVCGRNADDDIVLVHDGVRPFVSDDIIAQASRVAATEKAALVAAPVTDTIKRVDSDGMVVATIARDELRAAQTPQAFTLNVLRAALERASVDGVQGTDESMLVERLGIRVSVVEGDADNIKITTPADLDRAQMIAARREGPRRRGTRCV